MLLIFVIIIAAPVVLRNTKQLDSILSGGIWDSLGVSSTDSIGLLQPLDHGLNDTVSWYTGSNIPKGYSSGSIPAPSDGTGVWSI
jgi:1,3-beta-glucan synthase